MHFNPGLLDPETNGIGPLQLTVNVVARFENMIDTRLCKSKRLPKFSDTFCYAELYIP